MRTSMRSVVSGLLVLAAHAASSGAALAQDPAAARAQRVDDLFSRLNDGTSPGLAVAVVRDGEVLLSEGYGFASLEHEAPITPSTVFDLASLAKQFTGLAIAMLVDRGEIRLEDDVRLHIPELPDFGRPITIAHLLHHTSGLRDWPGTLRIAGWRYDDVISFDQILRMAYAQQDLNFQPGSEYTYSNTGYVLLAELVSRVTGRSFRDWMDEQVFRPLGMGDSHVHDDHTEVVRNRAYGYRSAGGGQYRLTPNNLTAAGSSSLFSTVEDLARWLIAMDEPVAIGEGAAALMLTRGVLNDGSTIPYAFGMGHGEHRGLAMVSHSGSWASFSTYIVRFPAQRFGVVVLANGGATNAARAAFDVVDIFLEDELEAPDAGRRDAPERVAVAPAILDDYAGLYRLGPGWYARIRRDGSALRVRATNEDEFPMAAMSETEMWVEAYDVSMTFARDAEGRVTHLTYRGMRAPRVEERPAPTRPDLEALVGEYASEELDTAYRVELEGDALVMRHLRHGTLPLSHVWADEFAASGGVVGSVEFQRDAGGHVVGLLASAGPRNRNLRFVRLVP
jgi:CubicO group peptidase (beta-lactamase class C family)